MCKGLAVVAEKIDDQWIIYAREGVVSHDELLHGLREDLRDGKAPHIKFEVYFPMVINDDILQDVENYYPAEWVEKKYGKLVACPESVLAVARYLYENKGLLDFTPNMLHNASLDGASLDGAWASCAAARPGRAPSPRLPAGFRGRTKRSARALTGPKDRPHVRVDSAAPMR